MLVKDQLGNVLQFSQKPKRIVSVVPSQSEFLWDIGLQQKIIGITKFCIHPDKMYKIVERVGGTKNLDIEKIRSLNPDLIIANKEENEKADIELLQKEFNVWISDIVSLEDAYSMMLDLGALFGKEIETTKIVNDIIKLVEEIKHIFEKQRVAYFIWAKPYMFAAKNTFIDVVINHIGLSNVLSDHERYPQLTISELQKFNPEFCFLSSEPFPFKTKHVNEIKQILPDSKIISVDGEMFSWYGSRLLKLNSYIKELKKQIYA